MNHNYQNLPTFKTDTPYITSFFYVLEKYRNYRFFIFIIENKPIESTTTFYHDKTKKEIYCEFSLSLLNTYLSISEYKEKFKPISENIYQYIPTQPKKEENKLTPKTELPPTEIPTTELIADLKSKLEKIDPKLIPQIRVFKHKKKDNKRINFMIDDLVIYTPNNLKDEVVKLLKSFHTTDQQDFIPNQNDILETPKIETISTFPIFQRNYKNPQKNFIKELLKKIPIDKLSNLQLYEISSNKKDKFDKPMKTNFKNYKSKSTLYYQKEDLPIIKQFLKQTKQGFSVKFCRYDQKQIHFNNTTLTLSNKNKTTQNNIDYYITLDGKKYYYLVLIDNNNSKNNKKIILNHLDELSKSQKNQIQQTYQKLENEKNIENTFHKLYNLFMKLTNK